MSTTNALPPGSRPRPILVTQAVLAAVGVVVTSAGFADQIPARAAWWIFVGYLAINVGLAFYLQSISTPLSDPRAADGTPLAPVPEILDALGDAESPRQVSPYAPRTPLKYTPGGDRSGLGRPDA